ncbi:MAG: inverse autotransporter beta domain-containing protein [Legionellales bacterium]|nr:inverse autotransporter beta domain-containing protein [Legionellales bacterium]
MDIINKKISIFLKINIFIIYILYLEPGLTHELTDNALKYKPRIELAGKLGYASKKSLSSRNILRAGFVLPIYQNYDSSMLYLTIIGLKDNAKHIEGNFGAGYRMFINQSWIGGLFTFYDIRETANNNILHQITIGIEGFSQYLDFRFNWYIPTKKEYLIKDFNNFTGKYNQTSNTTYFNTTNKQSIEKGLYGYDIEIGGSLPQIPQVELFTAYYHFFNSGVNSVIGNRIRGRYYIYRWCNLEAESNIDSFRKFTGYLGLRFSWDIGQNISNNIGQWRYRKMTQLPVRDIDIISDIENKENLLYETTESGRVLFVPTDIKDGDTLDGDFVARPENLNNVNIIMGKLSIKLDEIRSIKNDNSVIINDSEILSKINFSIVDINSKLLIKKIKTLSSKISNKQFIDSLVIFNNPIVSSSDIVPLSTIGERALYLTKNKDIVSIHAESSEGANDIFLDNLFTELASNGNIEIAIIGDFNLDFLNSTRSNKLISKLESKGFKLKSFNLASFATNKARGYGVDNAQKNKSLKPDIAIKDSAIVITRDPNFTLAMHNQQKNSLLSTNLSSFETKKFPSEIPMDHLISYIYRNGGLYITQNLVSSVVKQNTLYDSAKYTEVLDASKDLENLQWQIIAKMLLSNAEYNNFKNTLNLSPGQDLKNFPFHSNINKRAALISLLTTKWNAGKNNEPTLRGWIETHHNNFFNSPEFAKYYSFLTPNPNLPLNNQKTIPVLLNDMKNSYLSTAQLSFLGSTVKSQNFTRLANATWMGSPKPGKRLDARNHSDFDNQLSSQINGGFAAFPQKNQIEIEKAQALIFLQELQKIPLKHQTKINAIDIPEFTGTTPDKSHSTIFKNFVTDIIQRSNSPGFGSEGNRFINIDGEKILQNLS